ncbi:DUF3265 domain-containing protein [Vibrio alginolyticus]|nr:DUF3265 domain-containing protein [Vibrio alginolyticus]MCG6336756.1 DUF3265 domain-containing protein [Vibrio alginolyticus]
MATTHITSRSRAIPNAWHFCSASPLVLTAPCPGFGIALLTP